jgi:hypothetical protein
MRRAEARCLRDRYRAGAAEEHVFHGAFPSIARFTDSLLAAPWIQHQQSSACEQIEKHVTCENSVVTKSTKWMTPLTTANPQAEIQSCT